MYVLLLQMAYMHTSRTFYVLVFILFYFIFNYRSKFSLKILLGKPVIADIGDFVGAMV